MYKKYYYRDKIRYAIQFPERWARYHYPNTGPIECITCSKYGFWNDVFVCYCVKCANIYNYERGGGVYKGLQFGEYGTHQPYIDSACNTYLKDVLLDKIGDRTLFDSVNQLGLEDEWTGLETLKTITEEYHASPILIPKSKSNTIFLAKTSKKTKNENNSGYYLDEPKIV